MKYSDWLQEYWKEKSEDFVLEYWNGDYEKYRDENKRKVKKWVLQKTDKTKKYRIARAKDEVEKPSK